MLYVYNEDVGQMLVFDMAFVTRSVRELKLEIERTYSIPYRHQVLYVSGGEIMDGKVTVGRYQAGTDNNPVWLVDNRCYSQQYPPNAYIPQGPDAGILDAVDNSMKLPANYEAIVTRSQIAMRFHDIGKDEMMICTSLVKDQHFQHQGWLALKCTLEDKGFALQKNMVSFEKLYGDFLKQQTEARDILKSFESTHQLIKKIPIPNCLEHYASTESDRLLKESSIKHEIGGIKRDSSLTSCIDKLDKSDISSGPPSAGYMHESPGSSHHQPSSQESSTLGQSPTASGYDIKDRRRSLEPPLSQSPKLAKYDGAIPKQVGLLRHDSSLSQSPDTALTVSILEDAMKQESHHVEHHRKSTDISPTNSGRTSPLNKREGDELSQMRTLSDWIKGKSSRDPIEGVKIELEDKFSKLSAELRDSHLEKCREILASLDNRSMKEFKGLDKRLAGLEKIMIQMKKLSDSQSDMAQGFVQNQQRVRAERDQSVLPVMCDSHRSQLAAMQDNHRQIGDIKRRIANAKQELCGVIHTRIRWIMHMEERLREANHEIVLIQGMIRKLASYMKTLRQVHTTPQLYAQGVVEGYRRRLFSKRFLKWAGSLAQENNRLYEDELERRRQFNESLSGHFLMKLFSGFGEDPPPFATVPPEPFDTKLPEIDMEDIETIKQEVPEIAHLLSLPVEPLLVGEKLTQMTGAQTSPSLKDVKDMGTKTPSLSSLNNEALDGSQKFDVSPTGEGDDASDDIVVLNANGEQSVLTPSPDHKPMPGGAPLQHPGVLSLAGKEVSPADITQSVEVIHHHEDMGEGGGQTEHSVTEKSTLTELKEASVEGAVNIPGVSPTKGRNIHLLLEGGVMSESPQPPRSLSLHEDFSYGDDSLGTDSPPFQSFKFASLPDAHSLKSPPSLEMDDYATADFYIEESIPSAMSTSTPDRTIADLQVQLKEKSSQVEEQQTELQETKEKLTKMEEALGCVRRGWDALVTDKKLDTLKLDMEKLRAQALSDQLDVQQDLQSLGTSVTQLVNMLTEENETLENKVTDLQKEVETAKQKSEENIEERKRENEEAIKKAIEEYQEKLTKEKENLESEKKRLEEEVEEKAKAVHELEKLVKMKEDDYKQQIDSLSEVSETRITDLETQNKSKDGLIQELESKRDELESTMKAFIKDLEEKNRLIESAENEKETMQNALEAEKEKCLERDKELEELKQKLEAANEKICELETEKIGDEEDAQSKIHEIEEKIASLTSEHEKQMASKLEEFEAKEGKLKELQTQSDAEIKRIQDELEGETKEKKELVEKISKLEAEAVAAKEEYKREVEKCETMTKSSLLEHEVELDKVRSDLNLELEEKEQELKTLQDEIEAKTAAMERIKHDHEKEKEEMLLNFQKEKDEIVKSLAKEKDDMLTQKENVIKEELVKLHSADLEVKLKGKEKEIEEKIDEKQQELIKQHEDKMKVLSEHEALEKQRLREELEKTATEERQALEKRLVEDTEKQVEEARAEVLEKCTQEKDKEIREVKDSLTFDYHKRIRELQGDIEGKDSEIEAMKQTVEEQKKQMTEIKDDPNMMTLQKHGEIIAEMNEAWEEEKLQAFNKALTDVQASHNAEVDELKARLSQEMEDSLTSMQTSMTADKQVHFNQALQKAVATKDAVIEELKSRIVTHEATIESNNAELETLRETSGKTQQLDEDLSKAKEAERMAVNKLRSCEQELSRCKQQMQASVSGLGLGAMTHSLMLESPSGSDQRMRKLEAENKQLREQIEQSENKLTAVRDKVSIQTFSKGDVVLLCLDEKYDHYVVFTVGPQLLFLHSDCYEALSLNPVPGEQRRSWVLAAIEEKEYCQARKAQNRFKVPLGTKFFRVRCRPYSLPVVTCAPRVHDASSLEGATARAMDQSTIVLDSVASIGESST